MMQGLRSIRSERAALERNRVILGSMMEDAEMAELFSDLDSAMFEGVSSEEIEELINRLPESDDEDEQVEKIIKSDHDMDVDEILGIESDPMDDEE